MVLLVQASNWFGIWLLLLPLLFLLLVVIVVFIDALALSRARFGQGSIPIKLDEVACSGSESSILDCSFVSRHDCSHSEDASVVCSTTCECNMALFNSLSLMLWLEF